MAGNLFAKAKKAAPKTTKSAKDEKVRVRVKDPEFFSKVEKLQSLQERMKSDKAQADLIHDELKEVGISEWSKVYGSNGKNPGSIMLESKSGLDLAQFMFVPSDGYLKINEERANYITEKFGSEFVEEKTSFSFNNEMVDKYGEVLSQLIESCEDISDEDKEKIIKAVSSYSIAKGTIDKLNDMSEIAEVEIVDVIDEVKPIIAIKNVEVLKG
jgi:hypothetical protein